MVILLVIFFLSILILVHELGHFLAAKMFGIKVEEFGLGFPPKIVSKKMGGTKYSLSLLPLGGFVKIYGENGEDLNVKNKNGFSSRPAWKKSTVILAGILMNIALAWLIFSAVFLFGIPEHLVITEVAPGSPAFAANLEPGDIIFEIKTKEKTLGDPVAPNSFLSIVAENPGQEISLSVKRGDQIIKRQITPRRNPPRNEGPIGIAIAKTGEPKTPFPQNFIKASTVTIAETKLIIKSLSRLLSRIFIEPGVAKNIVGPIGIFNMATGAGSLGVGYLAELMAFISLNLAVLNLIPFPALDGGRFLFIIMEKLKGSPISFKTQSIVNAAGFIALIVLMGLVTIRDISKII